MWLIKGIVLGVVLFVIGFFAYALAVARRIHLSTEYGPRDLLKTLTARNPYFWLAFTGALMIGCAMVRCWPHNELRQIGPGGTVGPWICKCPPASPEIGART